VTRLVDKACRSLRVGYGCRTTRCRLPSASTRLNGLHHRGRAQASAPTPRQHLRQDMGGGGVCHLLRADCARDEGYGALASFWRARHVRDCGARLCLTPHCLVVGARCTERIRGCLNKCSRRQATAADAPELGVRRVCPALRQRHHVPPHFTRPARAALCAALFTCLVRLPPHAQGASSAPARLSPRSFEPSKARTGRLRGTSRAAARGAGHTWPSRAVRRLCAPRPLCIVRPCPGCRANRCVALVSVREQ
jgi:hypothetical protein